MLFNVTYEIISQDSAELGDAARRGFAGVELDLRSAIRELFEVETQETDCIQAIEPNCSDLSAARCVTVYNGMQYHTGNFENRSLHFPEHITPSSAARIVRLIQNA